MSINGAMPNHHAVTTTLFVIIFLAYNHSCWGFTPNLKSNKRTTHYHHGTPPLTLIRRTPSYKTSQITTLELVPTGFLANKEQQLEYWVILFASSHIGMSAIRGKIIQGCGRFANALNLIDRGIRLPSFWPGDDVGKNEVFPDEETAGRQIYRLGYTLISFATLGNAVTTYLDVNAQQIGEIETVKNLTTNEQTLYFSIVSICFAISISSLFNASPLGLMPGFERSTETGSEGNRAQIAGLQRKDAIKFEPRGLTRITRHPLILPVVPWGFFTAFLAGGRFQDFVLFWGLAIYAVAGCYCQDLRIIRKEGSVGTVFKPSSDEVNTKLELFYATTSFIPFAAVLDGRQSIDNILSEFPFLPFILGLPVGMLLEDTLLSLLQ